MSELIIRTIGIDGRRIGHGYRMADVSDKVVEVVSEGATVVMHLPMGMDSTRVYGSRVRQMERNGSVLDVFCVIDYISKVLAVVRGVDVAASFFGDQAIAVVDAVNECGEALFSGSVLEHLSGMYGRDD